MSFNQLLLVRSDCTACSVVSFQLVTEFTEFTEFTDASTPSQTIFFSSRVLSSIVKLIITSVCVISDVFITRVRYLVEIQIDTYCNGYCQKREDAT